MLLVCLLGSYVNIPIAYWPERDVSTATEVTYFGIRYMIPVVREWPATVLASIWEAQSFPTLLSLYLIAKNRLYGLSLVGIAFVAARVLFSCQTRAGTGDRRADIRASALATAVVAVMLSRRYAGPLAYARGSLGTLIGADLLNL